MDNNCVRGIHGFHMPPSMHFSWLYTVAWCAASAVIHAYHGPRLSTLFLRLWSVLRSAPMPDPLFLGQANPVARPHLSTFSDHALQTHGAPHFFTIAPL